MYGSFIYGPALREHHTASPKGQPTDLFAHWCCTFSDRHADIANTYHHAVSTSMPLQSVPSCSIYIYAAAVSTYYTMSNVYNSKCDPTCHTKLSALTSQLQGQYELHTAVNMKDSQLEIPHISSNMDDFHGILNISTPSLWHALSHHQPVVQGIVQSARLYKQPGCTNSQGADSVHSSHLPRGSSTYQSTINQ